MESQTDTAAPPEAAPAPAAPVAAKPQWLQRARELAARVPWTWVLLIAPTAHLLAQFVGVAPFSSPLELFLSGWLEVTRGLWRGIFALAGGGNAFVGPEYDILTFGVLCAAMAARLRFRAQPLPEALRARYDGLLLNAPHAHKMVLIAVPVTAFLLAFTGQAFAVFYDFMVGRDVPAVVFAPVVVVTLLIVVHFLFVERGERIWDALSFLAAVTLLAGLVTTLLLAGQARAGVFAAHPAPGVIAATAAASLLGVSGVAAMVRVSWAASAAIAAGAACIFVVDLLGVALLGLMAAPA